QIGGLPPDIGQPTAPLWRNLPIGKLFGKLFDDLSGGHRFLTHSILGLAIFGFLAHWLLIFLHPITGSVDDGLVWVAVPKPSSARTIWALRTSVALLTNGI